jgi:hypothetical protein
VSGNMSKAQALEWLTKYGSSVRGYPQEVAAAYLGLGSKRFRDDVAAGRLPKPRRHGKRLVWDKGDLDRHMDKQGGVSGPDHDPIMADIHANQSSQVRPAGHG